MKIPMSVQTTRQKYGLEAEIKVGDFEISILEDGCIEVWDSEIKEFVFQGTLDSLFKNKLEISELSRNWKEKS